MGTDIHSRIETKNYRTNQDGILLDIYNWQDAGESADDLIGRDYEIFAVIADVRNSDRITPISPAKGLPGVSCKFVKDLDSQSGEVKEQVQFSFNDDNPDYPDHPDAPFLNMVKDWGVWRNQLALHDISYLTLAEIKAFDDQQMIYDYNLVLERDQNGNILSKCRGGAPKDAPEVGIRKIFTWDENDTQETIWQKLINLLEQKKLEHHTDEDVRLIFAFDS
jgi:hypothetical protein